MSDKDVSVELAGLQSTDVVDHVTNGAIRRDCPGHHLLGDFLSAQQPTQF
jgi:hypothetical protein